jgi:hypothetical protein
VVNHVIFGPFESELFEVHNGLKQGCVLSPTLFNLVTSDMESMLKGYGGVSFGSASIKGLYYANDIVLFADTDQHLQDMLDVANQFATKWGMKYNSKKSQVLVVGSKYSNKCWSLGNDSISETKTYKYLGVIINKQLKDNNHIQDHLKSKISKLKGHIRYILAQHMDINRISFGNTLWHNVVLPSISHAGGTWFNTTKQSQSMLRSAQYQIGKAVLKVSCMPSTTATLGDLGWKPISEHLNIARISYYAHILDMPNERLPKTVYNELLVTHNETDNIGFNYIDHIKRTLAEKGLDHMFNNSKLLSVSSFKRLTSMIYEQEFVTEINERSSLLHYRSVKENTLVSHYLYSCASYKAVQLKFKLRTGISGIGEDLHRQKRGPGYCKACGRFETVKHFILQCEHYATIRVSMLNGIKATYGDDVFSLFIQDQDFALQCLLGDHDNDFNSHFLSYLQKAWTLRQNMES